MTNDEKIEFYARAYNTIQEIVRTAENNEITLKAVKFALTEIDNKVRSKEFTNDQQHKYMELTDKHENRIYFNL